NGETSTGYLKSTISSRTVNRNIPTLQHPYTNQVCTSNSDIESAATTFDETLNTPSPVDDTSISTLAATIPSRLQLNFAQQKTLLLPLTLTELQDGTERSPNHSSPGTDGLPYEILSILLHHPDTDLRNWRPISLINDLRNWRPISLINTDANIFTRPLNQRLMTHMSSSISSHQLGFMPNRFIADHGLSLHIAQLIATHTRCSTIALLLDQEKAYDRVHSGYLSTIMSRFGISTQLIGCIHSLFFPTHIAININGHLTTTPGDPLNPLLFNIAFDPFLRLIHQNTLFAGFNFSKEAPPHQQLDDDFDDIVSSISNLFISSTSLPEPSPDPIPVTPPSPHSSLTVKILAYADDTPVFLRNHHELNHLLSAIRIYSTASNAHLNFHKTEVISLSGQSLPQWRHLLSLHNIHSWHDKYSPSPAIYLGFLIISSLKQRSVAYDKLETTISSACDIHSQRNLSVRGRATMLRLEPKRPPFTHSRHRNLTTKTHRLLQSGLLKFHPFLEHNCCLAPRITPASTTTLDLAPFVKSLLTLPPTHRGPLASIRAYKTLTTPSLRNVTSTLSSSNWSIFWSLPIPLQARTVCYRLLHNKIPNRSFLHNLNPSSFPGPLCHICSTTTESVDHFFCLCPSKAQLWLRILSSYINSLLEVVFSDIPHLLHCVYRFVPVTPFRDPSLPLPTLSIDQIFACTSLGIWQTQWQSIFQTAPFSTAAAINRSLHHLYFLEQQRFTQH
ncbi:Transposon TX1 uncharacterized protein, partial [Choanephora cucurbitarum]